MSRGLAQARGWLLRSVRPWLAELLARLRPDVFAAHGRSAMSAEGWSLFLAWLVTTGSREYRWLHEDAEFRQALHLRHPDSGLTALQLLVYLQRPDVQAEYPLSAGGEGVAGWFRRHGDQEHGLAAWAPEALPAPPAAPPRPFGVNLIGHAFAQFGIGEDARMAARALEAAGVPFSVVDFSPGPGIPQGDRTLAPHVRADAPYGVNLFCMTAIEHARYLAVHGLATVRGRVNVGYWPWEFSRWPAEWDDLARRLPDELWASSTHNFEALAAAAQVPVLLMPMAVELGRVARRSRADFGLPPDAHLFCFALDLGSSIHRKNPGACVDAFLRAFPRTRRKGAPEVGLVIKAHPPRGPHAEWDALRAIAARDKRIHIIEATLSRPELLALYRCCDCFVSLHRAEGFGRNIAEALALGLHVIATGFSGNTDFCHPPAASAVRHRMVRVRRGQYPVGVGLPWAEPDVDHAADLMREVALQPRARRRDALDAAYAPRAVGERYKLRLQHLLATR